jgi:hypothetical protein
LKDGEQKASGDLLPGSYSVSEKLPAGWDLINATCSDGSKVDAIGLDPGETVTCVFENRQRGSLKITKQVIWYGDSTPYAKTFEICIKGPSYPAGDCKLFNAVNGWEQTWTNLIPGSYTVSEKYPGPEWQVTYNPATVVVPPGDTGNSTVKNKQLYLAYTPGFWKNHTATSPSGHDAWKYTDYKTTDQLGNVFSATYGLGSPKGSKNSFSSFTLLKALSFKGGSGTQGAIEILLRAGTATLLNASLNENLAGLHGFGHFPYSTQQVKDLVNAALTQKVGETEGAWRQRMLLLAAQLDAINNGGSEYFDWSWPKP